MKPAACLLINGLGQESSRFSLLCCHILNNIFGNHGIVRHLRHIRKLHLNFHLPGAAYLMVMVLHLNPPVLHHHAHTAAQVIAYILRG